MKREKVFILFCLLFISIHPQQRIKNCTFSYGLECGIKGPNLSPTYITFYDSTFEIESKLIYAMAPANEFEGIMGLHDLQIIYGNYTIANSKVIMHWEKIHRETHEAGKKTYGKILDSTCSFIDTLLIANCGVNFSLFDKKKTYFIDTIEANKTRIFISNFNGIEEQIMIENAIFKTPLIKYKSVKKPNWVNLTVSEIMFSAWNGFAVQFGNNPTEKYQFTPIGLGTFACKKINTAQTQFYYELH